MTKILAGNELGHRVTGAWREQGNGAIRAVRLTTADGVTLNLACTAGGWALSGADPDVWANAASYGFEMRLCPGHNGGPCEYGAHDALIYTATLDVAEEGCECRLGPDCPRAGRC